MPQIKVFTGVENDISAFEQAVNEWLAANTGIRIVEMTGNIAPQTLAKHSATTQSTGRSFSPSDLFVMFLYETE